MYYTLFNHEKNNKKFSYDLANMILELEKPPIFLCVGSNKIVDDSLGALTGELLSHYYKIPSKVFGNLTCPQVGNNLQNTLIKIKSEYYNNTIIVVDSSIGKLNNLYDVSLNCCSLNIDCLNSNKIVGDISISSVTYVKGINDLLFQNSEKKKCVFKLANFIASGIYNALNLCEKIKNHKAI